MINALASLGVGVQHQTKAPVRYASVDSYPIGDLKEMSDDRVVCFADIKNRWDMFARDYKNMHRGLRIHVFEGYRAFVFIDDL